MFGFLTRFFFRHFNEHVTKFPIKLSISLVCKASPSLQKVSNTHHSNQLFSPACLSSRPSKTKYRNYSRTSNFFFFNYRLLIHQKTSPTTPLSSPRKSPTSARSAPPANPSPIKTTCRHCDEPFNSKNQLHNHLRAENKNPSSPTIIHFSPCTEISSADLTTAPEPLSFSPIPTIEASNTYTTMHLHTPIEIFAADPVSTSLHSISFTTPTIDYRLKRSNLQSDFSTLKPHLDFNPYTPPTISMTFPPPIPWHSKPSTPCFRSAKCITMNDLFNKFVNTPSPPRYTPPPPARYTPFPPSTHVVSHKTNTLAHVAIPI